jgi:hypothetical protein
LMASGGVRELHVLVLKVRAVLTMRSVSLPIY